MKKAKRILALILVMVCSMIMTGCIRFSTTVEVKKNGKADISMVVAYQSSMGGDSQSDEDIKKLEEEGWKYTDYNQDGYTGYEFVKKNVDLKELAKEMQSNGSADDMNVDQFQITKHGSDYKIVWDIMNNTDDEDGASTEDYSMYSDTLASAGGYMKFILKLPYKPKNHNATEVSEDGKTLTWDLMKMQKGDKIEVEFNLFNWTPIVICLIAILVILAGVVGFIFFQQKKNAAPAGFDGGGYGQTPQGYTQQTQGYNTNQYGQQSQQYTQQPQQTQGNTPQQYAQQAQQYTQQSQQYTQQPQQPQQYAQQSQGYTSQQYAQQAQQYAQQAQQYTQQPQQPQQYAQQSQGYTSQQTQGYTPQQYAQQAQQYTQQQAQQQTQQYTQQSQGYTSQQYAQQAQQYAQQSQSYTPQQTQGYTPQQYAQQAQQYAQQQTQEQPQQFAQDSDQPQGQ